jgi:hypothetical protein
MRRRSASRTLMRMWDLFALIVAGLNMYFGDEDIPRSQRQAAGIGCVVLVVVVFMCVLVSVSAAH